MTFYVKGDFADKNHLNGISVFIAQFGIFQYGFVILATAIGVAGMVPSTVFTFIAVFLYGPWIGYFLMVIGHNSGAMLAYMCSRFIAQEEFLNKTKEISQRYSGIDPGWINIVVRLSSLPFAQMNYCMALLPMGWIKYFLTTLVGGAPLTFFAAFTYAGILHTAASPRDFFLELKWMVVIPILLYLITISVSIKLYRYLRRRNNLNPDAGTPNDTI